MLFNVKAILIEEQQWYYLIQSWRDKRVYAFPNVISPKVNVIAQLEFELTYYEVAIQHANHNTINEKIT